MKGTVQVYILFQVDTNSRLRRTVYGYVTNPRESLAADTLPRSFSASL